MILFIWNNAEVVNVGEIRGLGRLTFGLAGASEVQCISDIIHFLNLDKSSSISQLIKIESNNL